MSNSLALLCNDELKYNHFNNFKLALYNYCGESNFKRVNSIEDLQNVTHLFIVDEHYPRNVDLWSNPAFYRELNDKNIRVIIFNTERIHVKEFPWNLTIQSKVLNLKNHCQFLIDTEEAEQYKKPFVNRFLLSRDVVYNVPKTELKKEAIIFAGNFSGGQYNKRTELLEQLKKAQIGIPIDIINTKISSSSFMPYDEYLKLLSGYKYILCPLGTGNFLAFRHYEAKHLGCIPVQHIHPQMQSWYKEEDNASIFFTEASQLEDKLKTREVSTEERFLEDMFNDINLKAYI